ncbi:MAG: DUF3775 domain-containing protein [Hyphomicrobiales bacterium]|nr:DUF3775 domain-containing protein [Hyphomicrobiales bacterium]MCP5000729.1 DUF3775 domain-containing protein [Hyphomicrobiales bacterium]
MLTALTVDPDYLGMLMLKVRAVMAKEATVTPEPGGNPSDDEGPAVLQEQTDDLSREEILEEIEGLDPDKQAELVALMWLGRGDMETEEWAELLKLAAERRETPTATYLLDHPLIAEHWAEGLGKLGYGSILRGASRLR